MSHLPSRRTRNAELEQYVSLAVSVDRATADVDPAMRHRLDQLASEGRDLLTSYGVRLTSEAQRDAVAATCSLLVRAYLAGELHSLFARLQAAIAANEART